MATKTIDIADKPTLDGVKALLENNGYGLEVTSDLIGIENSKPSMSVILSTSSPKTSWESVSELPYNFYYSIHHDKDKFRYQEPT